MKTPDEIKKGLGYVISDCEAVENCKYECPYEKSCWPYAGGKSNASVPVDMLQDALAYIQQLEKKCHQLERERDAAVADLTELVKDSCESCCTYCKHDEKPAECAGHCWIRNEGFEWRGVKEE